MTLLLIKMDENVYLHIGSVLLHFLFLNKITDDLWPKSFATALFALHFLRVESLAWAAKRKDALRMFSGMYRTYSSQAMVCLNQGNDIFGCNDAQKACELANYEIVEAVKGKGYCR